ncbi:acyloxyacyl hydrolase [Oceanisphaera sp.]|uniref:acyloxyacyl hydrolase n=1 Tax=Oceanisphaera sp. TaxID=1929979 RepID=UPI003A910590
MYRFIFLVASLLAVPAYAERALVLGTGAGYGAQSYHAGLNWLHPWRQPGAGRLAYGLGGEVAYWEYGADDLIQVSLIPMIHYSVNPQANIQPFVFAGIGPAWISDTRLGPKDLSSEFQFSSRAGLGLAKGRHSLAVEARHLSNGGIKQPNDGISSWSLSYGYCF